MKMIKTDFHLTVNGSSSYIVYVTKTHEEAQTIHHICMTQKEIHAAPDWYYTVCTNKVMKDCRVPTFFHDQDYWVTVVEHNNGSWKNNPTYALYIVE